MSSATGCPQPACHHKVIMATSRMGTLDCLHYIQLVRGSERNSVVVGSNPTQANFL